MGEYSVSAVERHESDALPILADFLRVKTASRERQLVHDTLNQRCLSASWSTGKQNFSDHIMTFASGNVRKTKQCARQSLQISIRARSADTYHVFPYAAVATIWAFGPDRL